MDVNGVFFEVEKSQLLFFEDSALAAMFSGRWDESNEIKDGRVVIAGRDPQIFKYVVEFLQNGHKYPNVEDEKLAEAIDEEF